MATADPIAERHQAHYKGCGCLGRSAECCDPTCPCSTAGRLASALNVALSWHDNPTQGTATERDLELAGCRQVLKEWTDAD